MYIYNFYHVKGLSCKLKCEFLLLFAQYSVKTQKVAGLIYVTSDSDMLIQIVSRERLTHNIFELAE